jgi:hypothetical protein
LITRSTITRYYPKLRITLLRGSMGCSSIRLTRLACRPRDSSPPLWARRRPKILVQILARALSQRANRHRGSKLIRAKSTLRISSQSVRVNNLEARSANHHSRFRSSWAMVLITHWWKARRSNR